jgi:hypothetical protein
VAKVGDVLNCHMYQLVVIPVSVEVFHDNVTFHVVTSHVLLGEINVTLGGGIGS